MLVFRIKLSKKKLAVLSAAVIGITAMIILFSALISDSGLPDSATCDEVGKYSLVAQTTGGECGFLANFGYDAVADSRTSREITIPSEFNDTYNDYNKLQQKIGLDLNQCKGKKAKMITYELKNSKIKYAVILSCDGKVIAAHLTNGEYGDKNLPLI